MTMISSTTIFDRESSELKRLRFGVGGQVLTPEEEGYDRARMAWNLTVDQHPAVIVIPRSADDIVEAVRFADSQNLAVAVKATGHGTIREANDSLLIDTSRMVDVHVNAAAQTAWVSAGAKWGRVLEAAQAVGLAPLLGSTPDVGAVGYTLGGGMGWLARKYGLSADSVNYFELVTADSRRVRASAQENADLFWGLRGGGGNFGVVTGMEIRLYPVSMVYGGNLFYPISLAKEVYAHYRNWIAGAPDDLTSSVVLMNFPPVPAVPEFLRGQSFVLVRGAYSGLVEKGEELLQYWRSWQPPLVDTFRVMPFSEVAAISNDPLDPMPSLSSGAWLKDLDDETVETLIRFMVPQGQPPMLVFAEVRHAGGAISKVDPQSAAYGNRDALYSLQVVAGTPTPQIHDAVKSYVAQIKNALGSHLHGGVYLNFVEGAEARAATKKGFSADTFLRLQLLKEKYDPRNRFSHSYVISTKD
jgi:FAD/FMN-containing dehydrogenase